MNFKIFYYENYDSISFDKNNPRYVMSKPKVMDILSMLSKNQPFSLSKADFEDEQIIDKLLHIDVLVEKNGNLCIGVPLFLETDLDELVHLSVHTAKHITQILISKKDELYKCISKINNSFSAEINLYHLLSGQIFDGMMFDFLEQENLVTTSKIHHTGLDYLVIIYEDSDKLADYSDRLLCSYNRLSTSNGTFSSFGDSNGIRKDFYRFYRQMELDNLSSSEKAMALPKPEILAEQFYNLVIGKEVSKRYIDLFEYFGYVRDNNIIVPVYLKEVDAIVQELFDLIIHDIQVPIIQAIQQIGSSTLTSIYNGVDVKDIANEIYHLIFGEVNELLVKNGIVATPIHLDGEGRYLRCFENKSI